MGANPNVVMPSHSAGPAAYRKTTGQPVPANIRQPQALGGSDNVSDGSHPGNMAPLPQAPIGGVDNVNEESAEPNNTHVAPAFNPTVQAGSVPYGADCNIGYGILASGHSGNGVDAGDKSASSSSVPAGSNKGSLPAPVQGGRAMGGENTGKNVHVGPGQDY